jgi:hypothetical protein
MNDHDASRRGASMIDRELRKRGVNDGRRPDKPVQRNLGAGCSHVPVVRKVACGAEAAHSRSRGTGIWEMSAGGRACSAEKQASSAVKQKRRWFFKVVDVADAEEAIKIGYQIFYAKSASPQKRRKHHEALVLGPVVGKCCKLQRSCCRNRCRGCMQGRHRRHYGPRPVDHQHRQPSRGRHQS